MFLTGAFLLVVAAAWFAVPLAYRRLAERRLARRCRDRRVIALSYDDGPGQRLTPALLDLLAEAGVSATFFALGHRAAAHRGLIERILREGHELGSHTHDHRNAWKSLPPLAERDALRGIRTVRGLGGEGRLFRPPYGKLTLAGLTWGLLAGLRFGWWTVDSRDSWARRPIAEILAEIDRDGGGVVLMHDFDSYGQRSGSAGDHAAYVLELTGALLGLARRQGYGLVTVGALVGGRR